MTDEVVVVGAGGFGREALDVIEAAISAGQPIVLRGVVDSGPRVIDLQRLADRGVKFLGSEDEWLPLAPSNVRFIVAIGSPHTREKVTKRFLREGLRALTVIHPRATIGSRARIGDGVVVSAGVQVSTNVVIGDHVHLNPGSIVGHDTILEDYVSINPGAIISGNVVIERCSLVGAGAIVLQGLMVGAGATVGAAACAVHPVDAGTTVVGIPARTFNKGDCR